MWQVQQCQCLLVQSSHILSIASPVSVKRCFIKNASWKSLLAQLIPKDCLETVGEGSLTGPRPCLNSCNNTGITNVQLQCRVCLQTLCLCRYPAWATPSAWWFNNFQSPSRSKSYLTMELRAILLPICATVEKWKWVLQICADT